jgi:16S rRNA (uracil1498-N3)-methyltransferase
LVQCLPKGGRIDDIIRMTTEIGVAAIHLALAERSVARPDRERGPQKAERLHRVAMEAARQSEQDYVPDVEPPVPLGDVLRRAPPGAAKVALLARHGHAELPVPPGTEELWLAVGPEGGFSPGDQVELAAAGFISGGLGRSILRTETAAVVGVALGIDRLARRA